MTDAEFQRSLNRVSKYHSLYLTALHEAEREYELRFGCNPSEWDDDSWIDTFHQAPGVATVEQVTKWANYSKFLHEK